MRDLTDRQREVLGYLQAGLTIRGAGASLGGTSAAAAFDHIKALIRKGVVTETKGKGCHGRYELTPAGLLELGLRCCPTCAGEGTVRA